MEILAERISSNKIDWTLRCAKPEDAGVLSVLRVKLDGETPYFDREAGEDFLSEVDFEVIITSDLESPKDLFLVAEVQGEIVGYCRCIVNKLKRFNHQASFGIGILQNFCGNGIGKAMLEKCLLVSEEVGLEKVALSVMENNLSAIKLYETLGFVREGVLVKDKKVNNIYYNTLLMARWFE